MIPWNSASEGFDYSWQSKWVGIVIIKTGRTQIHFWSNVLVAVASLDLTVSTNRYATRPELNPFPKKERKKKGNSRAVCKIISVWSTKNHGCRRISVVVASLHPKGYFSDEENWSDDRKYVCVRWLTYRNPKGLYRLFFFPLIASRSWSTIMLIVVVVVFICVFFYFSRIFVRDEATGTFSLVYSHGFAFQLGKWVTLFTCTSSKASHMVGQIGQEHIILEPHLPFSVTVLAIFPKYCFHMISHSPYWFPETKKLGPCCPNVAVFVT